MKPTLTPRRAANVDHLEREDSLFPPQIASSVADEVPLSPRTCLTRERSVTDDMDLLETTHYSEVDDRVVRVVAEDADLRRQLQRVHGTLKH